MLMSSGCSCCLAHPVYGCCLRRTEPLTAPRHRLRRPSCVQVQPTVYFEGMDPAKEQASLYMDPTVKKDVSAGVTVKSEE